MSAGFADLAIDAQKLLDDASHFADDVVSFVTDETPSAELLAVQDLALTALLFLQSGTTLLADKLARAAHGNPMRFE